jgi:hypothetical protein
MKKKLANPHSLITQHRERFMATGLFAPAGSHRDIRYSVNDVPAEGEVEKLVALFGELAEDVERLAETGAER